MTYDISSWDVKTERSEENGNDSNSQWQYTQPGPQQKGHQVYI